MRTRFLLGPAGAGKTFRCLREVREALREADGPPLVFLAPKQATFQLERQLLADSGLAGYTRLHLLSFERLAAFVFAWFRQSPPAFLDDEGRVMVLRALLGQRRNDLKLFRASARMPGFAQQLGQLLRELQRHQLTPVRLEELGSRLDADDPLGHKLHDLALLLQAYRDWLRAHQLQDADCLLDEATALLRGADCTLTPGTNPLTRPSGTLSPTGGEGRSEGAVQEAGARRTGEGERSCRLAGQVGKDPPLRLGGLWLDGFAEMTPQELDLLAALAPHWDRATLAFCVESEPKGDVSWLSTWSVVARTFRQCHQRLAAVPDHEVVVEVLARRPEQGRFRNSAALQHLEAHWTQPVPFTPPASRLTHSQAVAAGQFPLRIVQCANAETEAVLAAREVLRFVHEDARRRFRDCAVLVRTLEGYHDVLRRVFTRYEIPFFLDRRESIAHHPLAELTRSALRTVAFQWQRDDWFGALKTGLVEAEETDIDWLENAALEHGWQGRAWQEPLEGKGAEPATARAEKLRAKLVPPFQVLAAELAGPVSGPQLAASLRALWASLKVEARLEAWSLAVSASPSATGAPPAPVHQTVWQQLQEWLGNVERAFAREALPPRDWLPILEAGLAGLTVGVIPPVLDQVLIGTIDRSRNPDLQLVLLLGMNEAVFPAPPAPPSLLTDADRETLARQGAELGLTARERIGHERYYGYIACTRSGGRLTLTCAARNAEDQPLNPSPFLGDLQRLFPDLRIEEVTPRSPWTDVMHVSELAAPFLKSPIANRQSPMPPSLTRLSQRLADLRDLQSDLALSPALAGKLYGRTLQTAVSKLEQFAACPFKFFISSGLLAEERKLFELDARERGSFQHEVLARFHAEVRAQHRQWRDLTPPEARELVGRIAGELTASYRDGLLQATDHSLFTARSLTAALQDFMAALIGWMPAYGFDPHSVELAFGTGDRALAAWELELGNGHTMAFRGKIDRVDLLVRPGGEEAWCVVLDYKSSSRKIDPLLLEHGIQIQLPAYLATLCQLSDPRPRFGVGRLLPAGMFYVNLRGEHSRGASRREVLDRAAEAARLAYQHLGQFSLCTLPELDRSHAQTGVKSGQFSYQVNQDGTPRKGSTSVVEHDRFVALLERVEAKLVEMGRAIYAGTVRVAPYRKGQETACDQCDYGSVCRIDPWTHEWRVLKKAASQTGEEEA